MRVLVIGGTGLISSAIARKLLSQGDHVVLFNRGSSNAAGLEGARRILADRYDPAALVDEVRKAGVFDCVIDMICFEPRDAESLVAAVRGQTPHVIFCSTVDVYAKPAAHHPVTEAEPRQPVNAYGRGKAASEDVVMAAAGPDLKATIIRPAHTYGPGGRHRGNFVHAFGSSTTFLDRLRRGKPVIVPGDGMALRGSCHLEDVSSAFVAAVRRPPETLRVCHVTSEEWITWNRYHQILAESLSAPEPALVHIPTSLLARIAPTRAIRCPENYQFNGIYNNEAARSDLGFRYTVPFGRGSKETLEWVQKTGGFENSDADAFYDEVLAAWRRMSDRLEAEVRPLER